jgi:ribosomal protein L24
MLDAKTKILCGKAAVKAADLKVGDRVVVSAAESKGKDGKITQMVKLIQVGAAAQIKTADTR